MQLTFLGTSCMKPTKDRNHSAIFLSYGSDGILFDCGEGTQRQLTIANIKPTKVNKIFISHWHGDHTLGLPGLIQTLGASDYEKTLKIYGPKGTKKHFKAMFDAFIFDRKFDIEIEEIIQKNIVENNDYIIEAYPLKHNIESYGFKFIEKDRRNIDLKKIKKFNIPEGPLLGKLKQGETIKHKGKKILPEDVTYIVKGKIIAYHPDSTNSKNSIPLAQDADILITDSTYASKLKDKAEEYMHMTAKDAALIASQADAKQLILTHFSTRYKDTQELVEDAKTQFENVIAAKDFMKIRL
ncbi:ribonuclease Z [Candidatus Woesearchaeota archaeon]|nr:ribonuclease Z [Candidatus Woesearchaeota archaeon]